MLGSKFDIDALMKNPNVNEYWLYLKFNGCSFRYWKKLQGWTTKPFSRLRVRRFRKIKKSWSARRHLLNVDKNHIFYELLSAIEGNAW